MTPAKVFGSLAAFLLMATATLALASPMERYFDAPCALYQVPRELALAIARTESDLSPWLLNISGYTVRPRSREEALRHARWALKAGRSFDVGLMQINACWIKKYGWPLEDVIEPANNAKIGVWILAREIRRHGLNWKAVGAYHSPTPSRQIRYARAVARQVKRIMRDK